MSTLPLNDRLTPDPGTTYEAIAGQTDFVADFPLIRNGAGAIEGLYVRRVRAGAETILSYQAADFTTTAEGDDGFTARLAVGALAGDLVQVYSQLPAARDRAHAFGGQIRTDTLEGDADSFEAQLQEVRRDLGRAVLAPIGDVFGTLPSAAARAGQLLGFDGAGAVTVYPRPGGIIAALNVALAEGGDYGVDTTAPTSAILPAWNTVRPGSTVRCADVAYNAGVNPLTVTVQGGGDIYDHGEPDNVFQLETSNTGVEFRAGTAAWVAIPYGS
jgi:hypothetical protein